LNPWTPCRATRFPVAPIRPLSHVSAQESIARVFGATFNWERMDAGPTRSATCAEERHARHPLTRLATGLVVGGGGGIRTRGGREPPIAFEAIALWPLRYPTSADDACHTGRRLGIPRRLLCGKYTDATYRRRAKNSLSNAEHSTSRTSVVMVTW
jgi:hypothetical protein